MRTFRIVLLVAVGIGLLSACQRSAEQLTNAVEDKPGVIDVEVVDNGGEADIPFASLPWVVTVTMEPESTEKQIRDVVDEYADDIDDEEVQGLTILVAEGRQTSSLSVGVASGRSTPWIRALAEGLRNPDVRQITVDPWVEPGFVGSSIAVDLQPTSFNAWHLTVLGYQDRYELADLSVSTGDFSFSASGNHARKEPALAAAQLRTAAAVNTRFGVIGARVWGSEALRLVVAPGTDLAAVRTFAARNAPAGTGRIVIVDDDRVDLAGLSGTGLQYAQLVVAHPRHHPYFRFARFRNGEIQIGALDVGATTYLASAGDSADDDLPLRYVLSSGSDFSADAQFCLPEQLETQEVWTRFSVTQTRIDAQARVAVRAETTPRAAGAALAKLCDGQRFTLTWPDGPRVTVIVNHPANADRPARIVVSGASPKVRAEIVNGWNAEADPLP